MKISLLEDESNVENNSLFNVLFTKCSVCIEYGVTWVLLMIGCQTFSWPPQTIGSDNTTAHASRFLHQKTLKSFDLKLGWEAYRSRIEAQRKKNVLKFLNASFFFLILAIFIQTPLFSLLLLKKKRGGKKRQNRTFGDTWLGQELWAGVRGSDRTEEGPHPHPSCAPLPHRNEHLRTRPPAGSPALSLVTCLNIWHAVRRLAQISHKWFHKANLLEVG